MPVIPALRKQEKDQKVEVILGYQMILKVNEVNLGSNDSISDLTPLSPHQGLSKKMPSSY